MLIFNEGVPGAGKTYDSVVEHVIPALRKGRKVFARINGLNVEELAKHSGRTVDEVKALLVHLPSEKVATTLVAERNEDGEFVIPDEFRNALIVVDEAHEFYVASREALPKEQEQFFAIQRHYGLDILLLTQWYKRLHAALRARIERKNVFQKLTAVGFENKYRVTFWATIAPDKYEKIGGETRTYKPEYFAAYKGVADGSVQTEVYEGGSRTVWKSMIVPGIVVAVMVVAAVWVLWGFFSGRTELVPGQAAEAPASGPVSAPVEQGVVYQQPSAPMAPQGQPEAPAPKPDPIDKMTPEQAYIWRLAKSARVRVSAVIGEGADAWGVVEFRKENQPPQEVLSTRQLQEMGVEVEHREFGFLLRANGEVIVATQWPTHEIIRSNVHELYRLDKDGTRPDAAAHASNASVATASVGIGTPGSFPRYGQFRDDPIGPDAYTAQGW